MPASTSQDLLIGIDAGTSVMKAVAFSLTGEELAMASVPNEVIYGPGGHAEQDLDFTWHCLVAVLRDLAARVPGLSDRAACLALTGQGDGTWLVDVHKRPVGRALLWLDGRSGEGVRALRDSGVGAQVAAITGTGLNTSQQGGQLGWLRDHEPERLARAHKALHCKDWLYLCCTGEWGTDLAEGLFTFGNPRTMAYDVRVLALLGLDEHARLLPPLIDGERHHAPLSAEAAALTGLRAGLPVVLAPMDVPSTALGAGLYAPGRQVGVSILGSTGMHARLYTSLDQVGLDAAPEGKGQQGYLWHFGKLGMFQGSMSHMAATLNIDWLCDRVADATRLAGFEPPARAELLARVEAAAAQARPGAAMYFPFISESGERGPFTEPLARAQFTGLSVGTDLGGLARAVYEGIAYATRDCYDALGLQPDEVRVSGGAARSPLLRQLLADVLRCPVRVSQRAEAGAAGAALVGAVSVGLLPDVATGLPRWVDAYLEPQTVAPGPASARYQRLFRAYRLGYLHQLDHWRALQAARIHHD